MNKLAIALTSSAALALAACGDTAADEPVTEDTAMADTMANDTAMADGTLVEIAQGNPDFSTLVAAVNAANLGETLSGPGPYTVFAPTNSAFDALPDGTVEDLTTNNTDQLATILKYHVVNGDVTSQALTQAITDAGDAGYEIETLGGGTLTATMDGGNVILTDATGGTATVTQTDIDASNGVIHAIDAVLMPQ
ncbi:fasciclin domain-containing protein [Aurantiacibacter spongiae]|uniref:Fasciclin domain-containing protein n=1 Tax=Aurantiacibacter spongiae TaxID=2488860 RepID=A0A3N5DBP8_9SPHN|nr:fasciclin domain-containing protein [Aurantiacibacter spongiae]RPF72198.1 fasciclin domain-containing protein [Aurantiacibacter spongiae]